MKNTKALYITKSAAVAALYVLLSMLTYPIASSMIQLRLSEALCILPVFMPEAVPGLFIGCLISNIILGCNVFDIIFGSFATLIGALAAYLLRKQALKKHMGFISTIPTIVSNTCIIPFVLKYAYGTGEAFYLIMISIFAGELLSAGIIGTLIFTPVRKLMEKFFPVKNSDNENG